MIIFFGLIFSQNIFADTTVLESRFLKNIHQFTFTGERSGEGYFSSNGKQMVFQSEREPGNPFYQIYLMNLESGATQRISSGVGKTTCSWVHPFQSKVLFSSTHSDPESKKLQTKELEERKSGNQRKYAWDYDEHYDLFEKDLKTGKVKAISPALGYDAEASYSPDGQWIAFSSNRHAYVGKKVEEYPQDPSQELEIYIMRSDGADLKRLTHAVGYDGGPFFSPDGERIIWRRFAADHRSSEVYSMKVDGSDQKQLTHDSKVSWAPYYHPSGDYFIYAISEGGRGQFDLYIKDSEGKKESVRVTDFEGFDGLPVFSPDGKTLAWSSNRTPNKKSQIFLAHWDDAEARKALGLTLGRRVANYPLMKHIEYLTSQELDGRLTGTQGASRAEDYVFRSMSQVGLSVLNQKFQFTSGVVLGKTNELRVDTKEKVKTFELNQDWRPLSFSKSGKAPLAEVVFAGYGIVAPAQESFAAYDSYSEVDVKGKWVMVLRYAPEDVSSEYRVYLNRYSNIRYKAMIARDRGALGLIIVSGPNSQVKDQLVALQSDGAFSETSLHIVSVTDAVAESLLSESGHKLKSLQSELDQGKKVTPFFIPRLKLSSYIQLEREQKTGTNVLGELKPNSSTRESSWIIVGAHLDHLGRGQVSNSRARGSEVGEIHPGADDNASGVSVMLEVASEFSKMKDQGLLKNAKRNLLFAAWTGEEMGVLGSTYFVNNKGSYRKISAYLNMDMVGRMKDHLYVQGVGSSTRWLEFLERANASVHASLVTQNDPYLPTDSTPFYMSKIPVLSLFTGAHDEYHTPRDKPDLIHLDGMLLTKSLMVKIIHELLIQNQDLDFVEVKGGRSDSGSRKFRVYLGTIPDYVSSESKGVKISGTQKDSPAEQAGMRAGDVITEFAGKKIENIYDYTYVLGVLKAGEKVKLRVMRNGQEVVLEVTPVSKE